MQAVIAVLPSDVIDQIAAGEVIERPASVVKELVDNAIDAGARTIAVETNRGGRELIKVIDDGCGMSPSDAVLAFERHATSKLRAFDDLWGVTTMGFRGEALPAIASVSRLTLTTRRAQDVAATRVVIDAGRLDSVAEIGAPVGTTVEVADVLGNVPARLKFLKADATEASHTTDLVAKIAMAYPALHVKLRHNGRIAVDAPPDRDVFARAQALLGPRTASRLVTASGEDTGIRVTCVLAAPELAQTTARGVQLFVGRRPVRDRGLLHAVAVGYGELVPRGRYPVAVVLVDPPLGSVDVNVHPQKAEVRFTDASAVCAAVRHVVQAAIARAPWYAETSARSVIATEVVGVAPPRLPFDAPASTASHAYSGQLRDARSREWLRADDPANVALRRSAAQPWIRGHDKSRAVVQADLGLANSAARSWARDLKQRVHQSRAAEATETARSVVRIERAVRDGIVARTELRDLVDETHRVTAPIPGFYSSLRYLGQLDLTYLVCEGDRELVLVDQHGAFECVELARLRGSEGSASCEAQPIATQRLLFPSEFAFQPELVTLASEHVDVLARIGFEVVRCGTSTLALGAVPAGLRSEAPTDADEDGPEQLLRTILERWIEQGTSTPAERFASALSATACRRAVRAGERIAAREAEALLQALDRIDVPTNGVHGRRVVMRLSLSDIARRFTAG